MLADCPVLSDSWPQLPVASLPQLLIFDIFMNYHLVNLTRICFIAKPELSNIGSATLRTVLMMKWWVWPDCGFILCECLEFDVCISFRDGRVLGEWGVTYYLTVKITVTGKLSTSWALLHSSVPSQSVCFCRSTWIYNLLCNDYLSLYGEEIKVFSL